MAPRLKLHQAFVRGREVPYEAWNAITTTYGQKPVTKLDKQRYDTIRADILQAVLTNLPKQEDNKARMTTAQKITEGCMTVVGAELTK